MNKKIISLAIATILSTGSVQVMANPLDDEASTDNAYTEIGIGAVGGAILAGPVGFLLGGAIGSIIGGHEDAEEVQGVDGLAEYESLFNEELASVNETEKPEPVLLASAASTIPVINADKPEVVSSLKDIISNDLSMDVYFKAGSVDVEKFYTPQLSVISSLLNEIPDLELNLDGYSDRQGDEADNLQLSVARLQAVRRYFASQGIEDSRIKVNAHGEKNFVSLPGELAAYVFDRRVVVSFTPTPSAASNVAAVSGEPSM